MGDQHCEEKMKPQGENGRLIAARQNWNNETKKQQQRDRTYETRTLFGKSWEAEMAKPPSTSKEETIQFNRQTL